MFTWENEYIADNNYADICSLEKKQTFVLFVMPADKTGGTWRTNGAQHEIPLHYYKEQWYAPILSPKM